MRGAGHMPHNDVSLAIRSDTLLYAICHPQHQKISGLAGLSPLPIFHSLNSL